MQYLKASLLCHFFSLPVLHFMTEPLLLALLGDMLQVQMPTGCASSSRDSRCADAERNMAHARAEGLTGLLLFLPQVSQDDVLMAHLKTDSQGFWKGSNIMQSHAVWWRRRNWCVGGECPFVNGMLMG